MIATLATAYNKRRQSVTILSSDKVRLLCTHKHQATCCTCGRSAHE